MGVEGKKIHNLGNSDLINKGSGVQLPPTPDQDDSKDQDHHHHHQDHDENIAINIPRTILKPIKIKVAESLIPSSDDQTVAVDHDDGLKTPTGEDHKIPVNPPCPPAPKKHRMPFKRRRILFDSNGEYHTTTHSPMRVVELSHEEIELMFPRRTTTTSVQHDHRPGNIRKVNKTNLTTTLMSFR